MSVIIFMWSQGFLSQTSSATGRQQGSRNQAAQSSIAIEIATFVPCSATCTAGTNPVITIVVRNVGAVAVTLGSLTITGISSNSGFTGSLQVSAIASTGSPTATDGGCTSTLWANKETATSTTLPKGSSSTIVVGAPITTACSGNNRVFSGDVLSIKITTSVGTFAQSQFTVP